MKGLWAMAVLLSLVSAAMAADTDNCTDVEIRDSISSSYDVIDCFAEADSIAASTLDGNLIGAPQMDLLAGFDTPVLPVVPGAENPAANLNSSATGVARISWLSGESMANNLTVVVSLDKFIQIWGNSTQGAINADQPMAQ